MLEADVDVVDVCAASSLNVEADFIHGQSKITPGCSMAPINNYVQGECVRS